MALDYNTAYKTFSFIQNSQLAELRKSLFKSAIRYAAIRSEWEFQSIDDRDDTARTMAHNRFIDSCNIFSREQSKVGEDNNWRRAFGNDRQLIGDFACYLSCFIGIKNR